MNFPFSIFRFPFLEFVNKSFLQIAVVFDSSVAQELPVAAHVFHARAVDFAD
jgi:hypothetical protein